MNKQMSKHEKLERKLKAITTSMYMNMANRINGGHSTRDEALAAAYGEAVSKRVTEILMEHFQE